ncbi:hypothetical protein [Paenibacillus kobensis]|uniref:hypothetical protein n=1 Tax=Paenibacillus kobensis TaxID=59841 RepID=UPI0013E3F3C6|nr:hypothetical protein [Paenibacillus kobensis]
MLRTGMERTLNMVREDPLSSKAKRTEAVSRFPGCAARGGDSFRVKECAVSTDGE